jgi:asparagine synthase (glutamine-hydrolysing)
VRVTGGRRTPPRRFVESPKDRLGVKPLYYATLPDQLVFASELKVLLQHPELSRELDPIALCEYLAYEYIPSPRAILQQVRKLPAGHWLAYANGCVKVEPYWDVADLRPRGLTEAQAVERLRAMLDTVVGEHMVSDVPLGVFLSGGIDSSTVAAFAARHASGRLKTFSSTTPDLAAARLARQHEPRLPAEALCRGNAIRRRRAPRGVDGLVHAG